MKKLKTLCAIVGAAMLLATPALAQQKINVPNHDINAASEKLEFYFEMTTKGPQQVEKKDIKEGKKYNKQTYYLFDRDKDGNTDLIRLEISQPELKNKDVDGYLDMLKQVYGEERLKQRYGEDYINILSEMAFQQKVEHVYLAIDEEFRGGYDGFAERIIHDVYNDKGEPVADGTFDQEAYVSPRIESYLPK